MDDNAFSLGNVISFIWHHPANRRRRFLAIMKAIGWQLYKRTGGRYWDVSIGGGLRLRCYPGSASASLMLYCNGRPEYHEMGFLEHYLRPGDGFLDVGGNIGAYTLLAASLGAGTIDVFEPSPEALTCLRENIELNGLNNVRVHSVAVADVSGFISFTRGLDATNRIMVASEHSVREGANTDIKGTVELIEVASVRLDAVVNRQQYAMGKMDIEGAEILALQGAEQMLSEGNPPVWLLELNRALYSYNFTEQQFASWLDNHGYELGVYDADSHTLRFPDSPWTERQNVLAISRRKRSEVVARLESGGTRWGRKD